MIKIEIKNRWTGSIIFEYSKENNTVKNTVLAALKSGANLNNAYLRSADLNNADLNNADLNNADLSGADLSGANLNNAYLSGADLRSADLRCANLRRADLSGANLNNAYLRCANLRSADLRSADLSGADLIGAVIDCNDNKNGYGDYKKRIDELIKNTNLKSAELYENHYAMSSKLGCFWNNILIIAKWEIKEKEEPIEEMTVEQICKALGKNIKIVK